MNQTIDDFSLQSQSEFLVDRAASLACASPDSCGGEQPSSHLQRTSKLIPQESTSGSSPGHGGTDMQKVIEQALTGPGRCQSLICMQQRENRKGRCRKQERNEIATKTK